jgi:azurin
MKLYPIIVTALVALVAAGCAKKETAKAAVAAPAPAAVSGVRIIEVTGNDQMKFNMTSIDLKVGEEVKIKLTNIGQMPKQGMAHNLVILKPGTDATAFAVAAAPLAMGKDNIPEAMKSEVVAHTKMLGPKESDSITLNFSEPGVYAFICTFPGHFQLGMHGTITVQ